MDIQNLNKIAWSCRRGMLELDVLLGNFFKNHYFKLSKEEKNIFIQLLEVSDQELFNWLIGKEEPVNHDFLYLVDQIRKNAKD